MIEPKSMSEATLDNVRIIYIRHRGSYADFRKQSSQMAKELFQFATKNNLLNPDTTKVLTMYDDNPFITENKNLRTSMAMTMPSDVEIEESEKICLSSISGKFMVGHFEISAKEYGDAWEYMYKEWLFKHEEQIRDAVPFELYVTEPPRNYKDKSLTDIYIPIK